MKILKIISLAATLLSVSASASLLEEIQTTIAVGCNLNVQNKFPIHVSNYRPWGEEKWKHELIIEGQAAFNGTFEILEIAEGQRVAIESCDPRMDASVSRRQVTGRARNAEQGEIQFTFTPTCGSKNAGHGELELTLPNQKTFKLDQCLYGLNY